ncbi:MAG TPA: F0F1 ATP synthase subunit delta [Mycobacteriales bacterium]|nr:F0F1 ATP synthase subunit delta [Mycobacteriales bacterium]
MRGASRDALAAALTRFEADIASLPEGAGSREVSDGLYAVATLLDREPALRRAFADPASSPESRRALVDALLGEQLSALPLGVLGDLVAQRWADPADLRAAVEELAATAALSAAEGAGALDEVEDELFRLGRLLEREPALRAALTDAGLPAERKSGLLHELLDSRAHDVTVRLVEVALTRPHGSLETRLEDLSRLAAKRRQRLVADVRTAVALDASEQERLATVLERVYGRPVALQVEVDPTTLGGAQITVGDELIDGTVRRRLDAARRRLAS